MTNISLFCNFISALTTLDNNEKVVNSIPSTGYVGSGDYGSFKKGGVQYIKYTVLFPIASTSGYYDILNLPSGAPAKYSALIPLSVSYGSNVYKTVGQILNTTQRITVYVTPEMISAIGTDKASIIVDTFYWIA